MNKEFVFSNLLAENCTCQTSKRFQKKEAINTSNGSLRYSGYLRHCSVQSLDSHKAISAPLQYRTLLVTLIACWAKGHCPKITAINHVAIIIVAGLSTSGARRKPVPVTRPLGAKQRKSAVWLDDFSLRIRANQRF
jgi:hypothetical protein